MRWIAAIFLAALAVVVLCLALLFDDDHVNAPELRVRDGEICMLYHNGCVICRLGSGPLRITNPAACRELGY